MRKDKEEAIKLRRAGKSYREIHTQLRIPRSTLSDWFGKEEWSGKVRERLAQAATETNTKRIVELDRVRGEHLTKAYLEAEKEAEHEFEDLKYDPLFIAGIALYWGEGAKHPRQGVKFANSDPKMIRLYIAFLTKACGIPIDRIKAYVLIYPDIEENIARAYWSKAAGLPWENFTKSIVIKGRHATRRLGWGVCTVSVSSNYFKRKILKWITLCAEELLKNR